MGMRYSVMNRFRGRDRRLVKRIVGYMTMSMIDHVDFETGEINITWLVEDTLESCQWAREFVAGQEDDYGEDVVSELAFEVTEPYRMALGKCEDSRDVDRLIDVWAQRTRYMADGFAEEVD